MAVFFGLQDFLHPCVAMCMYKIQLSLKLHNTHSQPSASNVTLSLFFSPFYTIIIAVIIHLTQNAFTLVS